MPAKVRKEKQKAKLKKAAVKKTARKPGVKAAKHPVKKKPTRNGAGKAARKSARKPVLRPAKLEFMPHEVRHQHAPVKTYFGLRLASFLLMLAAALTSSISVMAAGVDIERYEYQAAVELSQPVRPQEYLRQKAEALGYDTNLLHRIAFCESGWRMVKNGTSSAYGYFQIIDGTERHTPQYINGQRKYDPYANIDMALYLYGRYGVSPWTESRGCWGR